MSLEKFPVFVTVLAGLLAIVGAFYASQGDKWRRLVTASIVIAASALYVGYTFGQREIPALKEQVAAQAQELQRLKGAPASGSIAPTPASARATPASSKTSSQACPLLSIHDADRRELNQRSFSVGSPGSLDTRVRAAGRYYIRVKLGFCCVHGPDPYTISLAS
jgi:hypothetical protein